MSRTRRVAGAVRRASVPLTAQDQHRIDRLRSTPAGRAALDLHPQANESAVLARILAVGLDTLEELALSEGYSALARADDDEDRAFRDAVRGRRRTDVVDSAWPAEGLTAQLPDR